MAIREEADQVHFRSFPRERDLAKALDEAFDIQYGDTMGELSLWFAKPKAHTRERFGLYREVLVIYSRHQKTDARILAAINRVISDPRLLDRSEPLLTIIIHEGTDDDAKAVERQADRILILFRGDELLAPDRGNLFVRARLAEHVGAVDLFGVSSPLQTEAGFFGRLPIVEQLAVKTFVKNENSGLSPGIVGGVVELQAALRRGPPCHGGIEERLDGPVLPSVRPGAVRRRR